MPAIAAPAPTRAAVGCAPTPPVDLLDVAPPAALVADCDALVAILPAAPAFDVATPIAELAAPATPVGTSAEPMALRRAALFVARKPELEARKAEAEATAAGFWARLERAPGMSTLLGMAAPIWDAAAESWGFCEIFGLGDCERGAYLCWVEALGGEEGGEEEEGEGFELGGMHCWGSLWESFRGVIWYG